MWNGACEEGVVGCRVAPFPELGGHRERAGVEGSVLSIWSLWDTRWERPVGRQMCRPGGHVSSPTPGAISGVGDMVGDSERAEDRRGARRLSPLGPGGAWRD